MTDAAAATRTAARAAAAKRLKKRHAAERRFRAYGLLAILVAVTFLGVLLGRIVTQGYSAFSTHSISMQVYVDPARVDPAALQDANYQLMVADQLTQRLGIEDPTGDRAVAMMGLMSSDLGYRVLDALRVDPSLIGQRITMRAPVASDADLYYKGAIRRAQAEGDRRLTDEQLGWLDRLKAEGLVTSHFNWDFFTRGDSTAPELAGVKGAIIGSAMMLLVTALLAIPIGVLTAVYLEEFAPQGRFTEFIEVNINNLAAVPSIIFGLLGAAVLINWLGMPRSAPITGGVVLALMALPTVIIATRSSLKAVPPSIREAALGVGASRTQAVFHHVLPLAMPGVMTGAIIALAHALGETAPLLMIGMVSFVADSPDSFFSASSTLPTLIFNWEEAAERGFYERTAAAIMVLLVFMILMNAAAIFLRRRFERRW